MKEGRSLKEGIRGPLLPIPDPADKPDTYLGFLSNPPSNSYPVEDVLDFPWAGRPRLDVEERCRGRERRTLEHWMWIGVVVGIYF